MKPNSHRLLALLSLLAVLLVSAGCISNNAKDGAAASAANQPAAEPAPMKPVLSAQAEKANQELSGGIASYENGSYKLAARQLQSALTLGLEMPAQQAEAHKYLAFMHCVAGRKTACRNEFRQALEVDPAFVLTPAEAGHPIWGPVFRNLKAGSKPARK